MLASWQTGKSDSVSSFEELEVTTSSIESSSISRAMASSAIGVDADEFSIWRGRVVTNPEENPVVIGGWAMICGLNS